MAETPKRRRPVIREATEPGQNTAPDPTPSVQDAPSIDAPTSAPDLPSGTPLERSIWPRLLFVTLGTLAVAGITLSVTDLVTELMARNSWLGWAGLAVAILALVAFAVLSLRELAGLARLSRIEGLRDRAISARSTGDTPAARAVTAALVKLYPRDPGRDWQAARLEDKAADAPDAAGHLDVYERTVLGSLDERAAAEIRVAARRVAATTALMPSALIDAVASLYFNLRMIRRVAEIYGGRAGLASSVRLARKVIEHAMAAGLIAAGEDLVEPLIGGGIAGKLSRRAGQGVVNGALTARIGIAALEVCRPLPFEALAKPKLRDLAWQAVTGR
ncbi:MAG: TIGR01620 family protein [Pseudomonadota bacterium]